MAEEGAEREGGGLFWLPPRKRFKVMEQQRRREKERKSPGVGSHCKDKRNALPLHCSPPKKLTLEGFLLLEKQKHSLQQLRFQGNLDSESLPLPPRPVAVKGKRASALPLLAPPTTRLKFQGDKIHSSSPSAFKRWKSSSLKKGFISEASSVLLGIKKCASEVRRVSGQRPNLSQRDSFSDASFVALSKTWAMEKGTTCSMNRAQEDVGLILCEAPELISDTCSSDEDVIASTSTTLSAPLVAREYNVLVVEGHRASDGHMIKAPQVVEVDTLPSVPVEDGIREVLAVEEEGRESNALTGIITADFVCFVPLDDTNVDDSHYLPGKMMTVIEAAYVVDPRANDQEENADITWKMSSKSCLPPGVGPVLGNPVDGTELSGAGECKVEDAGNTSVERRGLEEVPEGRIDITVVNATLGVLDACAYQYSYPLTNCSSIPTLVKSIPGGAILNISKTSQGLMVTIYKTKDCNTLLNRCAKADRETCLPRKLEEVAAQLVADALMDLGKTELQGDNERSKTVILSDVLLVNGERVIHETDTKHDELFAGIDARADKLFKRMFERESHNGCRDEQDSSDVFSSQKNLASNLVNNFDNLVIGRKVDSRPTLEFQHLDEALVHTKGGRDADAKPAVSDHQVDLGRFTVSAGGHDIPLQQMTKEMPERSPRASEVHEDSVLSKYPETDRLIPPSLENVSCILQEQLHGIHCQSLKENSDWDLGIEIPNFSVDMRSGMTQRVKAPSRWVHSSEIEPTNLDEAADEDDDDGACDICRNPDAKPSDPIVYCDGCDVAVHADCYGNPLCHGVPEGDWFCAQCQSKSPNSRSCCLCPRSGGAMKKTTDGNWAHISCTVFVPEVYFRKADDLEGIDTSHVPRRRWLSTCCVCKSTGGACVDCTEIGCKSSFHVSCALKEDLAMEFRNDRSGAIVISFCQEHTAAGDEQQETRKVGRSKYRIVSREPRKFKNALKRSKLR